MNPSELAGTMARSGSHRSAGPDVVGGHGPPAYKTYGAVIADEKFEPAGFAAPLGFKDVRLTLAAAEALRVPLPIGSLLHDLFLTLLARGGDKLL
jgi:3-hydroxyisobutyrate dehydrogenase-like beta-hydroxyacid dehydrogenase